MENSKNDKKRFLLTTIALAALTLTILIWGMADYSSGGKSLLVIVVALITAAFGFILVRSRYQSLKRGEPLKDERSRKLETQAAAYAFYIGIYWLLALSMIIDNFKIDIPARSVPGLGLAGLAIIFGLSYWYLNKTGE